MPSPVIPAPAVPHPPTACIRTPVSDLPVARAAEPVDRGGALTIVLDRGAGEIVGDGAAAPVELRVTGEIDLLTVTQLRAALDQALTGARGTVAVDLRGVSFVDCAGIGVLVEARWRARRRGLLLQIVPGRVVARTAALLDLTATLGLDEPR